MFKNYLKTSLRFFANNKGFSLLNMAGLSIGTLCCIYILLYVRNQYGYDRYFSNAARLYIGLAALIQLVACINFMNLATARASRRAKEVGVRKVVGADNKGLVLQFLVESFLISLAAMLIVLPMLVIALPWLNKATGADLPRTIFLDPAVCCLLVALAIVTGLLAGSYPAFYLSAFQTTRVIKGDLGSPVAGAGLRRSLVVFQFVLSIVLIVSMIIIRWQLDLVRNKALGFYKDGQIVFDLSSYAGRKCADPFAVAVRRLPEVRDARPADNYPGALSYQRTRIYRTGASPGTAIPVNTLTSDEHFLRTMGIRLVGGVNFTPKDSGSVLINRSMAQRLGLEPGNAPGRRWPGRWRRADPGRAVDGPVTAFL